jgi:hypothetical protein
MKHGSGIKGRDDRSSGIEISIADALVKINPTEPLILAKQAAWRNLNCSESSGISFVRSESSRWVCRNSRRLKSFVDTAGRVYCNGHESYWFGTVNVQLSIIFTLVTVLRVPSGSDTIRPPYHPGTVKVYCKTYLYWQTSNTAVHYAFISRDRGPPRIYFPRQAPWQTGRQTIFFFPFWVFPDEEMVGDRETRQPGGEFESTTGSVQVKDHECCRVHPFPTKRESSDPPPSDIDGCDWNGLSVSFMT